MTSPQTPSLVNWPRAAVVVAVCLAATGAFALITPTHELGTEEFLAMAFARSAEVRSVHITQYGSAIASNGDVRHWNGESDLINTGDSQGYVEYEGCTFQTGRDVYLCRAEWVETRSGRYAREITSEDSGDWERHVRASSGPPDFDAPFEPAGFSGYWSRAYGLTELDPATVDGIEYRRFWVYHNFARATLDRLEAGEWELPAEVDRQALIDSLQQQAETESGWMELWARADDGTIWKIVREAERTEADGRAPLRAPTSARSSSTLEYSRYNEPVEIRPPIP